MGESFYGINFSRKFIFANCVNSKTMAEITNHKNFTLHGIPKRYQIKRVVQYSDKFMHGIVLYSLHITILYKSITIKNEAKQ